MDFVAWQHCSGIEQTSSCHHLELSYVSCSSSWVSTPQCTTRNICLKRGNLKRGKLKTVRLLYFLSVGFHSSSSSPVFWAYWSISTAKNRYLSLYPFILCLYHWGTSSDWCNTHSQLCWFSGIINSEENSKYC